MKPLLIIGLRWLLTIVAAVIWIPIVITGFGIMARLVFELFRRGWNAF